MEEKGILSTNNKREVKTIKIMLIICLVLCIASIISFIWGNSYQSKAALYYDSCDSKNYSAKKLFGSSWNEEDCMSLAKEKYSLWSFSETPRTIGIIGSIVFIPSSIIVLILYLSLNKMELVITNKRVYGKSTFGRRVDLPVDSISSIGKNHLSGITVATSSGKIKWYMINKKDEVYDVLEKLIIKRQDEKENATKDVSIADELKKYKELLDEGAITEEEYKKIKNKLIK